MEISGYEIGDVLYSNSRTIVYRARDLKTSASVIIKAPVEASPAPRTLARYQVAYDLGVRAHSRAVPRPLELVHFRSSVAIVYEDLQADTLASVIPPDGFQLLKMIEVSTLLAETLSELHAV